MIGPPKCLGVVGAGTMGTGIAQLGCFAGFSTVLHDPLPEALAAGAERIGQGMVRWAAKGMVALDQVDLLETTSVLGDLADCDLVIEAVPEEVELKRGLLAALSDACRTDTVLATNTSSIPITVLAGAAKRPENVVGMHFFNPPPLMRLLEVIAADQTSDHALELAQATGRAMGKEVILAADGPGFIVNRCGRPFYTEALRCLQERLATHDAIDRICRLGAGFRMGPFELMDLVGIDSGLAIAESFAALSFGEPRWRPNPIQARLVAAGRLGRKSGCGFYAYAEGPYRPEDAPAPSGHEDFEELAAAAGLIDCSTEALGGRGPVGYARLPGSGLVELCGDRNSRAEDLAERAGLHHQWVGDAPGLVLNRVICQLVNEAAFALGEGVGSVADLEAGALLGLNHPRGPTAWAGELGLDRVLATLDGLWLHYCEDRYRPAPLLRFAVGRGLGLAEAVST